MQPRVGVSRTAGGSSRPNATTMIASAPDSRRRSRNAGSSRLSGSSTGRSTRIASALTGDASGGEPARRRGRSGRVTTKTTRWEARSRARSEGIANSGVPMKTSLMGGASSRNELPVPGAHLLLDLLLDEAAFEHAQVLDEQVPIEMVQLVIEGAGQEIPAFDRAHL